MTAEWSLLPRVEPLDIVVFGATGYTGGLIAEHLAQRRAAGEQSTHGLAGRSLEALVAVRDAIGAPADTPLLRADAADPASLRALARSARTVISTVGPYQLHGSGLVAACVENGTDYLDLCGEPAWMRQMILSHHEAAVRAGARILFACGFDSLPSELGVWLCQRTARELLDSPLTRVRGRVRRFHGTFSGGTGATIRATMSALRADPSLQRIVVDPFALTPGFEGPKQPDTDTPDEDPDLGKLEPFMLGDVNRMSVHRSNLLQRHAYGTGFLYDEKAVSGAVTSPVDGSSFAAGEGPTKEQRDSGCFDLLFSGTAADGREARVSISGDRDPGYGTTAQLVAETALCLLSATDVAGGIWTPVAALQDRLLQQLEGHTTLTVTMEVR